MGGYGFVEDVKNSREDRKRRKRLDDLAQEQWNRDYGLRSRASDRADDANRRADSADSRAQGAYDENVRNRASMREAGQAAVSAAEEAMRSGANPYTFVPGNAPRLPRDPSLGAMQGGTSAGNISGGQSSDYLTGDAAVDRLDDREILARTLEGEARSEGYDGMLAAGAVIDNRAASGRYGKGLRGVILKDGQFSAWNGITGYAGGKGGLDMLNMRPSQDAYRAADAILSRNYSDPTGGATHYYNPASASPEWGSDGDAWKTIGRHTFGAPDGGRVSAAGEILQGGGGAPALGSQGQDQMPPPPFPPATQATLGDTAARMGEISQQVQQAPMLRDRAPVVQPAPRAPVMPDVPLPPVPSAQPITMGAVEQAAVSPAGLGPSVDAGAGLAAESALLRQNWETGRATTVDRARLHYGNLPGPEDATATGQAPALGALPNSAQGAAAEAQSAASSLPTNAKPEDRQRATETAGMNFRDAWKKFGMPRYQEELIRRGMVTEAMAMDEWINNEHTLAGIESYGRAFAAAAAQDFDSFGESILDLYNNEDYYGDGLQIVRNESGFTSDRAGNMSGAVVTFKDASGKTFKRQWNTIDELMMEVATMASPEAAFQTFLNNRAKAPQVAAEQRAKQADRVTETYNALSKQEVTWGQMTEQERSAMVQQRMAMEDALVGGKSSMGAHPVAPLRRQ